MKLADLQRWVETEITRPPEERLGPLTETRILPGPHLSGGNRLEIYHEQYWLRTLASLEEDFPALQAYFGDVNFRELCIRYLRANPSRSWTLRDLGQFLPGWIAEQDPIAAEIARVEWARIEAFDAAEFPCGEWTDHLRLQPHVQLLALNHPVDRFVNSINDGEAPEEKNSLAAHERVQLAVYRGSDFNVQQERLASEEYAVLLQLATGKEVGDALEAAGTSLADTSLLLKQIHEWFRRWTEMGWLYSVGKRT